MQIGKQLNRTKPKLSNESYSDGLKELVSFSLESDPSTRPSMADILSHPYIADTEEQYPISSLSELVKIYYQWSQRGGQRASLFHPGGAAAAEIPDETYGDQDWNFSTTDGFERRFSVLDLDQLAASLAEMEEEIDSPPPRPSSEAGAEPASAEMTPNETANFNERVRRGAEAMEGIFDEKKPDYRYETKNDFVPVEDKQMSTDLPLRTVTDRSSVASTFIDIDIGAFDSSHYAAGLASAQPFQLADANTIRANKSSTGRQNRGSSGEGSQVSTGNDDDSQNFIYQQQSGPRPPTMEWKFPAFTPTPDQPEEEPKTGEVNPPSGPDSMDKRATMEWTFPVMGSSAGADRTGSDTAQSDLHGTIKPLPSAINAPRTSTSSSTLDLGEPGDARPLSKSFSVDLGEPGDARSSRALSIDMGEPSDPRSSKALSIDLGQPGEARPSSSYASSHSDLSESEYDPFRFDRPSTPRANMTPQRDHFFSQEVPAMWNEAGYSEYESSVLDGPGPDEEDTHPLWRNSSSIITDQSAHVETFPSVPAELDMPSGTTSPTTGSLPTIRRAQEHAGPKPVEFPVLTPPSMESLTDGADDNVIAAEMTRLLGDFLDSLKATGDALSSIHAQDKAGGVVAENDESA